MQLGLLSPQYLRRLFERMGATYIKLGQVSHSIFQKVSFFYCSMLLEFVNNFIPLIQ
jgi:aarF domain-containing kinase